MTGHGDFQIDNCGLMVEQPGEINLVNITGPPWFDYNTGELLEEGSVREAMDAERASLRAFETYDEVPEDEALADAQAEVVSSRWLIIRKASGRIKCRLVAQQLNRGELMDTFAATASGVSARLVMAVAMTRRRQGEAWVIKTGDVATAFLHASLPKDRRIYIKPPSTEGAATMWRLKKALYGLRESPRLFQQHLAAVAEQCGWVRGKIDPQLYYHEKTGAMMSVFADDLLIAAPCAVEEQLRRDLEAHLKIKWGETIDEKAWVRYLGKEWKQDAAGNIMVRIPPHYWQTLLEETGMSGCRSLTTPMERRSAADDSSALLDRSQRASYRRAVGRLLWTVSVRPDIGYSTKELARHVSQPTCDDEVQLKHVLRYIAGTVDQVLYLGNGFEGETQDEVTVQADADWASGPSRRSTSGGAVFFNGVLLNSWSRTQPTVALSTCEAELLALGTAAQEGRFTVNILEELRIKARLRLYSDSSSARAVVMRRGVGRLKHLAARQLWLQAEFRGDRLELRTVSSAENLADLFTKPFTAQRHWLLADAIGLGKVMDGADTQ